MPASPAPRSHVRLGVVAITICILCWGSIPVVLRSLRDVADPWSVNGIRYPMAALLYLPLLLARRREVPGVLRRAIVPALLALGGQILWGITPYHLPASAISFGIRITLLWSLIASMLLFPSERKLLTRPLFYLGLSLLVGGFAWFYFTRATGVAVASDEITATGIVILLACSVFFGLYGVSVRYYLREVPPLLGFGVVCQIVALGTLVGMLVWGKPAVVLDISAQSWALLVGSSFLGIAAGHALLYTAVQQLGPSITTGSQTVGPFVTALLASIFLGETLLPIQWLAGITMVGGAICLVRSS